MTDRPETSFIEEFLTLHRRVTQHLATPEEVTRWRKLKAQLEAARRLGPTLTEEALHHERSAATTERERLPPRRSE